MISDKLPPREPPTIVRVAEAPAKRAVLLSTPPKQPLSRHRRGPCGPCRHFAELAGAATTPTIVDPSAGVVR